MPAGSTAADRDHDFEPVARYKLRIRVPALWHDLAVALDRDALASQVEGLDEPGK